MTKYPTGVETHGESLRIWFMYNGRRHRENLGVPDTLKNRRMAGELRASVCFAIKMGTFDYALQFPNSSTINHNPAQGKEITITELSEKWLDLKSTEITKNALIRYTSYMKICALLRHGELRALSWEDVDTKNWTIKICRNLPIKGHFTPPKTASGVRIITLTSLAINALKSQMLYTKMCRPIEVDIHLREYGKIRKDSCSFIFRPRQSGNNNAGGEWYSPESMRLSWNSIMKKAGIRHRKSYESRHTFACWALSAGANPNFIAEQMGHTSAQMVYTVYGKWMADNNSSQIDILNTSFTQNAPSMPHEVNGSY